MDNLNYKLKLCGTLNEFTWDIEYDTQDLKQIESYSLEMRYNDSDDINYITCTLYRDEEFNLHSEIRCDVPITSQHLNYLIESLFNILRELSVTNDELVISSNTEDYETLTHLIDCIGMVHTITNIVSE